MPDFSESLHTGSTQHSWHWNKCTSSFPPQRLNQAAKSSSNSTGAGAGPGASSAANKLEILKEEEEEVKRKVEQCKVRGSLALPHGSAPGLQTCSPPPVLSEVTPRWDGLQPARMSCSLKANGALKQK